MAYPQAVERWRPLVEKYFAPEDVEKALYVIQWESSGNPDAQSDSGGYGLMQLNDGGLGEGYSIAQRLDPETNIRVSAQAVYGGQGWRPWGEGSEQYNYPYDPATGTGRFGSLGDRPYGSSGGEYQSYSSEQLPFGEKEYLEKYVRYQTLLDQYNRAQSTVDPLTGAPQAFDPNLLNEMFTLEYELSEYDRIKSEGGTGLDDELARLDYWNKNNPALIDAQNSANEWARQQTLNDMAQSGTRSAMQEQRLTQDSANAETAAYKGSSVFTAPMGFRVGATDLPTEDEVFARQMEMASAKLPEVKPIPYAAPYPVQQAARAPSAPTQSFGKLPTEDDFRSAQQAFTPPPSTEGQWQGPVNPRGSSVFRAVTNPLDAIRSTLLGSNPALTTRNPVATALPTPVPSRTPTPTGTPTPPSVLSPYGQESRVAAGLRRYVGSIFGGR